VKWVNCKLKKTSILLMDINLKGDMSGIDAAEQIRAKLSIPVIYLTAYADESTLAKAKVTEPYGYIIKPFKEIDLVASPNERRQWELPPRCHRHWWHWHHLLANNAASVLCHERTRRHVIARKVSRFSIVDAH
jgi:CheY-like chemotaxis protein